MSTAPANWERRLSDWVKEGLFTLDSKGRALYQVGWDDAVRRRYASLPFEFRTHCAAAHKLSRYGAIRPGSGRRYCSRCRDDRSKEYKEKLSKLPKRVREPKVPDIYMSSDDRSDDGYFYPKLECGHAKNAYRDRPIFGTMLWCTPCGTWKVFTG